MRIGIVQGMPAVAGGGFQYEMTFLDALSELAATSQDELVCIPASDWNARELMSFGQLSYGNLPVRMLEEKSFQQGPPEQYAADGIEPPPPPQYGDGVIHLNRDLALGFRRLGIDWVFQLQPSPTGFSALMPFVMPIHDLQHRLQPEFPEVSADGQIAWREYLYRNVCRQATLVLVESEHGKQDVLNCYDGLIGEDRIRVLPLFPPLRRGRAPNENDMRRVREKYRLPARYFFYPAQFWRHKNHHLIIEAMRRIESRTGVKVEAVFTGGYAEKWRARNFRDVMKLAEDYGLRDRVHYLGFAPDDDMPALYAGSDGLVMPTFFGPSNIPALEAWKYGCPVITSDIPGIREQTGDGGLLVNPRDPDALAEAMLKLWRDDGLRHDLAARGAKRLASYSWSEFVGRVGELIAETSALVRAGRTPGYPLVSGLNAP